MDLKCTTFFLLFNLLVLHSHQRPFNAKSHLVTYGFLETEDPPPKTLKAALKKFQSVNNLPVTGVLNDKTIERMKAPRCGRPSNVPMLAEARNKWGKSHLTYKIINWTEPLTKTQIKKVFDEAIMAWTNSVNLTITETTSERADIEIYFTEVDNKENILGYAYFPENGDIFFDRDENWTVDPLLTISKTGFVWVATHELGHSLGMPHTETMSSIMFPYYTPYVTKPSNSDITRMKKLYGEANKKILCDGTSVNSILESETSILIKGNQYWTISNESVENGPFFLDSKFPGLPGKIDAAFTVQKKSYFLSDKIFYKFTDNSKISPSKMISAGFDNIPGNIDAAFFDSTAKLIYFFKGSKYYVFDIKKPVGKRVVVNGKSIQNDWDGLPKDIEAATLLKNSRALFIKNSKCYIVNLNSKQIVSTEDCFSTFYKC